MKVVVDDKIETIRGIVNENEANLIEAAIEDIEKPEREANGLFVLTPKQFKYWKKESEAYAKRLKKEGKFFKFDDEKDKLTAESYVAPITFPSKEENPNIKSFTPEIEKYHERLNKLTDEEKEEQEKQIENFIKEQKNSKKGKGKKKDSNNSSEDGFNSEEEKKTKEEVFYNWKNKDELSDLGTPFILPDTAPSFDALEKKEKTVPNPDSSDPFTSYALQRKKEQESRERIFEELEMPKPKTKKEVEEEVLETFANLYGFSFNCDNFLEHKKQLPLILLPEKLKALFLEEAEKQELTPSQLFGQVFLRYMFKKNSGEEV